VFLRLHRRSRVFGPSGHGSSARHRSMARVTSTPRSPKSPLSSRQVHRAMVILDASSGNQQRHRMSRAGSSGQKAVLQCVREPGLVLIMGPATGRHETVEGGERPECHDDVGGAFGGQVLP
jgi:hypothetical protein